MHNASNYSYASKLQQEIDLMIPPTTPTTTTTTTTSFSQNNNDLLVDDEKGVVGTACVSQDIVSVCSSLSEEVVVHATGVDANQIDNLIGMTIEAAPSAGASSTSTTSSIPLEAPPSPILVLKKKRSRFTVTKAAPPAPTTTEVAPKDAISISFLGQQASSSATATKQVIQKALAGLRPGGVFFVLDYKTDDDDDAAAAGPAPCSAAAITDSTCPASAISCAGTDTTGASQEDHLYGNDHNENHHHHVCHVKQLCGTPTEGFRKTLTTTPTPTTSAVPLPKSPQAYSVAMKEIPDELVEAWNLTVVPTNLETYYCETLASPHPRTLTRSSIAAARSNHHLHHTLLPASQRIVRWMGFKPTTKV